MKDEYENISPLYMQRLKGRVEHVLWDLFAESKYRQVEEYIRRWYESDGYYQENFSIFEMDGHIDLSCTLANMPNEILIKIAADIGVETPGLLPCIPLMKNVLNQNNTNAYSNFERAVRNVYENPDQSVALAASTLEGLFKTILQDTDLDNKLRNDSLSKLTGKTVKALIGSLDSSTPPEIKALSSHLLGLGCAIDDLRSDKSTAHGKTAEDYVVDDSLWAETVVNVTAAIGLLLWRLFERSRGDGEPVENESATSLCDDEIPF